MLRHALRRLLWMIPTLVGVTIVTFFFLSFVPDPTDDPALVERLGADAVARLRRERFLDLPRFVNLAPLDVRARARAAVQAIAAGGPDAEAARRELARLGGAALPHVLPMLDALGPEPRTEVALALAPIAERMGLSGASEAYAARTAAAFWTRFWDDRGAEFKAAPVKSAVQRLARYGTAARAAELRELDTFVLEHVLAILERPQSVADIDRARALVDLAAAVSERDDRIRRDDDLAAAQACVDRWRAFWVVHRADFVVLSGPSRATAMLTETRFGKWALVALTRRLGDARGGGAVLDEMARRAPVTLVLLFGAIALAYGAALPLGMASAASRGRKTDLAIALAVLGSYAVPTAAVAVLAARAVGRPSLVLAVAVLALGLVAAPTRQVRSAVAGALSQDFVLAALARGASRRRVVFHALRGALVAPLTLAALEAPMALGGAFVVERVFGLPGLGEATIHAVQERDVGWLMALALFTAASAAVFMLLTDVGYALVDPRLRSAILGHRRAGGAA